MAYIYRITCTSNNAEYVGSTHSLHKRLGQHESNLRAGRHENQRLQRTWDKYGPDAFTFLEVARPLPGVSVLALEQVFIDDVFARGVALNINRCAENARLGMLHSVQTRDKIRAMRKGSHLSPEARAQRAEKMRDVPNPMWGRVHNVETRALISARLKEGFAKGRPPTIVECSPEARAALSARHKGNAWRLNKGKPLYGLKDGELRVWLTTVSCAKDLGCDTSYPSQRVDTDKLVKGWTLRYIKKDASSDELEARIRARLASFLPKTVEVETVQPKESS